MYGGNRDQLDADVRASGGAGGWRSMYLPERHNLRSEPVAVLTQEGHAFAEHHVAAPELTSHWFRMYEHVAARIGQGGTVRRVLVDAELKAELASRRNRPVTADEEGDRQAAIAKTLQLRVVDGAIQIPDLRIEYDTREGTAARVDLELATGHYKRTQSIVKAQAGFTIYAPPSQVTRVSAPLEERGWLVEILSL